jgi:ABC-type transport system involved in multi-copper enzyme maturation permease subunit
MKQTKFSLADLLTLLGTLVYGFFCFLSLNFYTLGETITSLIGAAAISLTLGVLAFSIKLLKTTSQNFKTKIITEGILLFLFIVFSLSAIIPFSQFFAVSQQKDGIQQKVIKNITDAEGLYHEYERYADMRLSMYKAQLNSVVLGRNADPSSFNSLGFVPDANFDTQVNNKLFTWKAQIYPSNYADKKRIDSTWLADAKEKINEWSPLGIVSVVNVLKSEIPSWREQLKQYSGFRAAGEKNVVDFDFVLTLDEVSNQFNQILTPTLVSIVLSISINLLMLLSYFITKRHTRFPGFRAIFRKASASDNEL